MTGGQRVADRCLRAAVLVGLVGVILLPGIRPTPAHACSCAPPPGPLQSLAAATAVFRGAVTRIEGGADAPNARLTVTIDVREAWKGTQPGAVGVVTAPHGFSCGYPFVAGTEYLVYAEAVDSVLEVSLCSRTAPASNADFDLAELGQGTVTAGPGQPGATATPAPGQAEPADFPTGRLIAGIAIVAAMAAVAGAVILRRADGPPD